MLNVCFLGVTQYFQLSSPEINKWQNTVRAEIFSDPNAHVVTRFCLFGLCVCLCLTETDRQIYGGGRTRWWGGVSINTVSVEAQGLSDPPVNLRGGCRGHRRGQRSPFMLITNNAQLCPQHREKTVTTGCSYKRECNYKKNISRYFFFIHWVFTDFSLRFS